MAVAGRQGCRILGVDSSGSSHEYEAVAEKAKRINELVAPDYFTLDDITSFAETKARKILADNKVI